MAVLVGGWSHPGHFHPSAHPQLSPLLPLYRICVVFALYYICTVLVLYFYCFFIGLVFGICVGIMFQLYLYWLPALAPFPARCLGKKSGLTSGGGHLDDVFFCVVFVLYLQCICIVSLFVFLCVCIWKEGGGVGGVLTSGGGHLTEVFFWCYIVFALYLQYISVVFSFREACPYHYRWIFGKVPNGL